MLRQPTFRGVGGMKLAFRMAGSLQWDMFGDGLLGANWRNIPNSTPQIGESTNPFRLRPATWFFRKRVGVWMVVCWFSESPVHPVFGMIYFKKKLWYSFYDWLWFMGSSDIYDINSWVIGFFLMFYLSDGSVVFRSTVSWAAKGENSYQRHALHFAGSAPASDEGPMGAMFIIGDKLINPSP